MQNRVIIDQTRPDQTRPDHDLNYGLSMLKIWMSFGVVLSHFWNLDEARGPFLLFFRYSRGFAVPVFMFMAFLFTGKYIISRNKEKVSARISRLFIMQVSWAVIYTVFLAVLAVSMNAGMFAGKSVSHVCMMFVLQVIFGHSVNATMWFQADLIFITAMLAVIYFKFSDKTALVMTWLCVIIAFALQYSGINFMLFGGLNPYMRWSLGRVCEMIPVACAGILFVKYGLAEKFQANRKTVIFAFAAVFVIFALLLSVTGRLAPKGFNASGIYINVFAISLTVIFMLLPLKNIPAPAKYVIGKISRFTPGVYCMHRLTALCLQISTGYKFDSFAGCIVIYVLCLAVSFVVSLFFRKGSKYLVG